MGTLWIALCLLGCDATDLPQDTSSQCQLATNRHHRGALVATHFKSLEALRETVSIAYLTDVPEGADSGQQGVMLIQCGAGTAVVSVLQSGVTEEDFKKARDEGFWAKVGLAFRTPFAVWNRKDILKVYVLSRRKHEHFGAGDVAFYDFAEQMVAHIREEDKALMPAEDLDEKGYLNSFNHVTAQAFVTAMFSEELADFVADVHERHNMPELITGNFTSDQLSSPTNNPMDNYVDMINNEWGQELGKQLKRRYGITPSTRWTPELLTVFLNDLQAYYSWSFAISMHPFTPKDREVQRFAKKLNQVLGGVTPIR